MRVSDGVLRCRVGLVRVGVESYRVGVVKVGCGGLNTQYFW